MTEDLINKEVIQKSLKRQFEELFVAKENVSVSKLEFEEFKKETNKSIHKVINNLQSEIDKLVNYFKQQLQPINKPHTTKGDTCTEPKLETARQNDKKYKNKGTSITKATDKEAEEMPDADVPMHKTEFFHRFALSNDSKLTRKVIVKLGDIVQEEVDVIVNAANMELLHNKGVAAAIDKASGGIVQKESKNCMHPRKLLSTGSAVATVAGGALKCKYVVHAVGPDAVIHVKQCDELLKKACVKAMEIAKTLGTVSIAFPPISSGRRYGVKTELVAEVMLSTLCSFTCTPTLLSDVCIVIIDKPTSLHLTYL